jgi:DNA-binding XRE family transcriptional regulator
VTEQCAETERYDPNLPLAFEIARLFGKKNRGRLSLQKALIPTTTPFGQVDSAKHFARAFIIEAISSTIG